MFLKHLSKNKNHEPFVYYAINNHCYLVDMKTTNEEGHNVVQSLIKKARPEETKISSMILGDETEVKTNIYNDKEIFENVEVEKLIDYKDCVIIYNEIHLNNILDKIILHYNFIPTKLTYHDFACKQIKFNYKKLNILLVVDPNREHQGKTQMTWKIVRDLCKKLKVQFRNQSFNSLISELKQLFFNHKPIRKMFTKQEREEFIKEHPNCNKCQCKLDTRSMHIDHITPLAAGGDNEPDNLQALCKKCHFVKTKEEK